MSSQFSYELDERQIKILMQSGEVDYNETAWQRFESNINKEVTSSTISNFSPKINFGISRSIIVPILFVGLIGGLSVILFSFVDFKKKEEPVTEVSLKITPPVVKPVTTPKKEMAKVTVSPKTAIDPAATITTPTIQTVAKTVPSSVPQPEKDEKNIAKKPEANVATTVAAKTENKEPVHKKKRKRKMVSESLQSIAAPTSLNNTTNEPELQLK